MSKSNVKRFESKDADSKSMTSTKFENNSSVNEEELITVPYNESSSNGFIFNNQYYIPEEVLLNILAYHVDYKTLLSCQLVCKQWNLLIQHYVWHKKAEFMLNHVLPLDPEIPWTAYYFICHKMPFTRNLIKNHSGQKMFGPDHNWKKNRIRKSLIRKRPENSAFQMGHSQDCDWKVRNDGGHGWAVEAPPQGVPALPDDPVFDGKNCCFVTSYGKCWKQQIIDLEKEGFSPYILDNWQPTIKVSEWFSSHKRCGSVYTCTIELSTDANEILGRFNYSKVMRDHEDLSQWFKFEHEFKNYGKGLRKIIFSHGGQDTRFWAGHFGSKMAGACIQLEVPDGVPEVLELASPVRPVLPEPYYFSDDAEFSESEDSEFDIDE